MKDKNKDKDLMTPFPKYIPLPEIKYNKLWRLSDQNSIPKLFMTVVESPSLQLLSNLIRIRRCANNILSSNNFKIHIDDIPGLASRRFTLDEFRSEPFSPFIPDIIVAGINNLELNAHQNEDWDFYTACIKQSNMSKVNSLLHFCINKPTAIRELKYRLTRIKIPDLATCILKFLTLFEKKPLHFDYESLKKVLSKPLYDKFLRPNPDIKEIVKAAVLKTTRTEVDTLSFIMLHIIHVWEYSKVPITTKIMLAKRFGPRLISFEEEVFLYKTDYNSSPQAAMLEAILEICDSDFWVIFVQNSRQEIFQHETYDERKKRFKLTDIDKKRPETFSCLNNPYSLFSVKNFNLINDQRRYTENMYFLRLKSLDVHSSIYK